MVSNWFPDSTATWLVIVVFYIWAASELFSFLIVKGNDAGSKGLRTNEIQPQTVLRLDGVE